MAYTKYYIYIYTDTYTPVNESAHQSPLILMDRRRLLLLQATVPPARACLRACCHTFSLLFFYSFSILVLSSCA